MANGCYRARRRADLLQGDRPRHLPALRQAAPASSSPAARRGGGRAGPAPSGRRRQGRRRLHVHAAGKRLRLNGAPTPFPLRLTTGCSRYPEADIDITGRRTPASRRTRRCAGTSTRTPTAWPSSSSAARCTAAGRGTSTARRTPCVDCPDHDVTDGNGAILEAFLSGEPTPRPGRLADVQGLAGARLADPRGHLLPVAGALLARRPAAVRQPAGREQQALPGSTRSSATPATTWTRSACRPRTCTVPGLHRRAVRRPRQGLLPDRHDPFQARKVINAGKMAVVMGIETSVPFGCTFKLDRARPCDASDDRPAARRDARARRAPDGAGQQVRQRARRRRRRPGRGRRRRSTPPTSSRPGPSGTCGTASPPTARPTTTTRSPLPDISAGQQDALFGAIGQLFGRSQLPALPVYPPPAHCNSRGLTTLGEHTISGLAKREMIFDPDHMSVKARQARST